MIRNAVDRCASSRRETSDGVSGASLRMSRTWIAFPMLCATALTPPDRAQRIPGARRASVACSASPLQQRQQIHTIRRMGDLRGHGVLVAGGTSGIGAATANAFHARGADTSVLGLLPAAGELDPGIKVFATDITGPAGAEVIASLDRLDVLVNCAGIIRRGEELDPDVFERVLRVNLTGTMRACTAARRDEVGRADELGHEPGLRVRVDLPRLATCSIRPSLSTAMRLDMTSASDWSWVTYTAVRPSSRCSRFSSNRSAKES
ncbi:MAG: SDR family NAD(P)-dependent oxidoreductase [Streptosporangiales bacterium]|nr:SDR family NAD(P)-dependent oxidoreductase [Streptosporangiales bacterium]